MTKISKFNGMNFHDWLITSCPERFTQVLVRSRDGQGRLSTESGVLMLILIRLAEPTGWSL